MNQCLKDDVRGKLECYVSMVVDESSKQSLISAKTLGDPWQYHVRDSLQLAGMIKSSSIVVDIGSGAGFPGVVVGIASGARLHLVEPRTKRVEFLQRVVGALGLSAVVHKAKVSQVSVDADVVVARAAGSVGWLLANAYHLINSKTEIFLIKQTDFCAEVDAVRGRRIKVLQDSRWIQVVCDFDYSAIPLERQSGCILRITKVRFT